MWDLSLLRTSQRRARDQTRAGYEDDDDSLELDTILIIYKDVFLLGHSKERLGVQEPARGS